MTVTVARAGTERRIAEICEKALQSMGFRLVRVRFQVQSRPVSRAATARRMVKPVKNRGGSMSGQENYGQMQLMIERLDGAWLDVDACAQVHRHVSTLLDVADPIDHAFQLEVSSPGVQRPLTENSDFTDYIGSDVELTLAYSHEGRRRIKGVLQGVNKDSVLITQDTGEVFSAPLVAIADARLRLTDALLAAAQMQRQEYLENMNNT